MSSSPTLISIEPIPLLRLAIAAAERFPSALWLAQASTLVRRIRPPPKRLLSSRSTNTSSEQDPRPAEQETWDAVGDSVVRLTSVATGLLDQHRMREVSSLIKRWVFADDRIRMWRSLGSSIVLLWVYLLSGVQPAIDA